MHWMLRERAGTQINTMLTKTKLPVKSDRELAIRFFQRRSLKAQTLRARIIQA